MTFKRCHSAEPLFNVISTLHTLSNVVTALDLIFNGNERLETLPKVILTLNSLSNFVTALDPLFIGIATL